MSIQTVHQIYYSPTHTGQAIVNAVAEGCSAKQMNVIDLTSATNTRKKRVLKEGIAVIGVPVYSGRVAPEAAKRLASIRAEGIPAILVVIYGNREFEDALIELQNLATKAGFNPIAAASFIGEHSYSSIEKPIAAGRPDMPDVLKARELGITVIKNMRKKSSISATLKVPGNFPYKDSMGASGVSPSVDVVACKLCGDCVKACPVGAISIENQVLEIDNGLCTMCCACVKVCSKNAMSINAPGVLEKIELLFKNCQTRKEPELFFINKKPFESIFLKSR